MSQEESLQAPAGETPSRGFPLGRIVIALGAIAFVGWLGVRIKAALATRAQIAAESKDKAATAVDTEKKTAEIVRGVPTQWTPSIELEGTLVPLHESDIAFKAGGRVSAIHVHTGQFVQRGQLLATLDDVEASAQKAAAAAGVRAAEAQLALSTDSERRTAAMVSSGSSPEATGVAARGQKALVEAQLDGARAQLALASANLENQHLVAPFSGFVTRAPSSVGGIVMPGTPLFHLQDTTTLKLAGTVGEVDAALVRPGASVSVCGPPQAPCRGAPGSERNEGAQQGAGGVTGTVSAVMPSVDPATRRVPVEVTLANRTNPPLLGGVFARATIGSGGGSGTSGALPVLKLPGSALRAGSQDEILVVQNGRAHLRHISWTPGPDGALFVRAGLAATEDVLLAPPAEAKEGDAVNLATPTAAAVSPSVNAETHQ